MKIGRCIAPAAARLDWSDLWNGAVGICSAERSVRALEADLRRHLGVDHVFLLSSGTAALTVTLMALKTLSERTEVIIPAYTCFSVPAAVLAAGLRPSPCDIDPTTFDFNRAAFEQGLNDNTLCVIAHHLFGIPSDIEGIRSICRARRVFVVEDAAQAMGIESRGHKLGTIGDVGVYSFGRGKNITCGSGGIIVTNSATVADAVAPIYLALPATPLRESLTDLLQLVLMAIFIRPRLYWIPAAIPGLRLGQTVFPDAIRLKRLSGMKAGVLRTWRIRLAQSNRSRSDAAAFFGERLPLRLGRRPAHPYLRLPILLSGPQEKRAIYSMSQARGLGLSAAYPTPVDELPQVRSFCKGKRFPSARRIARRLVTIPTHHWVSEKDKSDIAELWRENPPA